MSHRHKLAVPISAFNFLPCRSRTQAGQNFSFSLNGPRLHQRNEMFVGHKTKNMKNIRSLDLIAAALLAAVAFTSTIARAQDPLPSWNEGPAKQSIITFVGKVTTPGSPDFVPVPERIAVFDNDGTLWSEQPAPVQFYFVMDRVKALAPQHPEWKTKRTVRLAAQGRCERRARRRRPRADGTVHGHAHRHDHRRVCADGQGLDRHGETSGDRQALPRHDLSADARSARLFPRERLQELHRLRRRHRVHAPVGGSGLWHPAGTGRGQQHEDEV